MANIVPAVARQLLEKTIDEVRIRANSEGECFGGEISDAMRDAGAALGADRLEVLLTRSVLVRTMESLGEKYPAEMLQDYEHRVSVSVALKYLRVAIDETLPKDSADKLTTGGSMPSAKPEKSTT
jgi:hypothetical protein